jgi:endonuclease IV
MLGGHCYCPDEVPLSQLIQTTQGCGWTAFQIFFGPQDNVDQRRQLTVADQEACAQLCQQGAWFRPYTHYPYKANLVKPFAGKRLAALQSELTQIGRLGGRVVIHPNSPTIKGGPENRQITSSFFAGIQSLDQLPPARLQLYQTYVQQYRAAIDVMINNLKKLNYPAPMSLLLEPPAGEGQKIGWSLEQMQYIASRLIDLPGVGFCIDTCHSFAAGLSRFDSATAVDNFWNDLARVGVLPRLKAIHLNDSLDVFESLKDNHAPLADAQSGQIWGRDVSGLIALVQRCREWNVDIICETAGEDGVKLCHAILASLSTVAAGQ